MSPDMYMRSLVDDYLGLICTHRGPIDLPIIDLMDVLMLVTLESHDQPSCIFRNPGTTSKSGIESIRPKSIRS